ncbi:hypothetical protein ACH4U5_39050 [Streptomyces sp. NPDC020858]|uniref:hypothetical protein n=1 Tax=Streptomyces sp. NPDC020858 TaxID=3365097 RepID=UPI0037965CE7
MASEADMRRNFACRLWELVPGIRSGVEAPQRTADRAERLDLPCTGPSARTAIEFK